MGLTVAHLKAGAVAVAAGAAAAAAELNEQDGRLGDGDLGVTLAKGWQEAADALSTARDDLGQAFLAVAKAFQRVSSSSFGTLTATAFMAAAKRTKGRSEIPWRDVSGLVVAARDAMMERGKGALGDKTVLDSLDAIAKATDGLDEPAEMLGAADRAVDAALATFRAKPNRLGRARMFGDKSAGLDDPGMLAVRRMLDALGVAGA